MPKYKLLVIMQKDPLGEGIGGMHTYLRGLVKCLPDDFEVELVGITTDRIKRPVGKWGTIKFSNRKINFFPVLFTKNQNKIGRIPLSLRFVMSLFRYKSRIPLEDRILEFHRIEPAILFKKSRNIKVIFIHGNVEELYNPYSEVKWSNIPWLYFQLEKKVIPNTDKVLVVSEEGLNFYKKRYEYAKDRKDRFSFVPTWVDKDIFHPLQSGLKKENEIKKLIDGFQTSASDKILLFAGRLVGSKNPLLLIDSFHKLYTMDKNVKLLIIGDGSLKRKIRERVKGYKLDERVKLLDILPQDRLAKLIRVCDLVVLTSACEGMPRVVIEALASGIPVVSTNVGEVWRVVKDNYSGLLVPEHNDSKIAKAIIKVLKNKKEFNSDNCLNAVKDYRIDVVLNNIYEIFRNLASADHKS